MISGIGRLVAATAAAQLTGPSIEIRRGYEQPSRQRQAVQMVAHNRYSRLNRSKKWPYAETYKEARLISPFPNRPVR